MHLAKNQPRLEIILNLSSFEKYCYLHITEILTYSDLIVTQAKDTHLYFMFHSNGCNPYITLNNNDITLISKDYSYILHNAIPFLYSANDISHRKLS